MAKSPFDFNFFRKKKTESPKTVNKGYTGRSFTSSNYIIDGTASWSVLNNGLALLDCYENNPIVQSVINIKAEAFANVKFFVKDLKTEEVIPLNKYKKDGGALNKLITRPNPLQSTYEWLRQFKINYEVFGNGYQYASLPVGFSGDYTDITVMNNLQSYCVKPILTGKWLEATKKQEIISGYEFRTLQGKTLKLPTESVFHMNNANIRLDNCFTEGVSDLIALAKPISNINGAFESRNVLIRKRGALGLLSSNKKDEGLGSIALTDEEIEEIQESYKKYGLMDDQYSMLISPYPLDFTKMAMSVKELMLFEEIDADTILISNAKGVPELLTKTYVKGGTFENLNASEKRLYDSTIIPEWEDFQVGLNSFLNTIESGIELIGSYDHVNVLQTDKKQEAEVNKINCETAKSNFMTGLTNYGQYAIACGVELEDSSQESLMIWDLSVDQRNAIGVGINQKQNSDGQPEDN